MLLMASGFVVKIQGNFIHKSNTVAIDWTLLNTTYYNKLSTNIDLTRCYYSLGKEYNSDTVPHLEQSYYGGSELK